jgi:hypothetical protein
MAQSGNVIEKMMNMTKCSEEIFFPHEPYRNARYAKISSRRLERFSGF